VVEHHVANVRVVSSSLIARYTRKSTQTREVLLDNHPFVNI
jgi:hypothetical protein